MAKKHAAPTPAMPMLTKADTEREADYRAEDDHRTLTRAQEIAEDRGRMAGVRKHHRKLTRSLSKVGQFVKGGR